MPRCLKLVAIAKKDIGEGDKLKRDLLFLFNYEKKNVGKGGKRPWMWDRLSKRCWKDYFLYQNASQRYFGSACIRNLTENHSTKSRCQRGCVFLTLYNKKQISLSNPKHFNKGNRSNSLVLFPQTHKSVRNQFY